jgi:hypothetical protein
MAVETDIKNQIKTLLGALVTAGTLGEVQSDDFKKNLLFDNIAKFPAAIVSPAAIDSDTETNRDNLRTYEYQILIVSKAEAITSETQIEDLREAIMNAFDNDPTLSGKANGGLTPSSSRPEPDDSNSYIAFLITIKAKALYTHT